LNGSIWSNGIPALKAPTAVGSIGWIGWQKTKAKAKRAMRGHGGRAVETLRPSENWWVLFVCRRHAMATRVETDLSMCSRPISDCHRRHQEKDMEEVVGE